MRFIKYLKTFLGNRLSYTQDSYNNLQNRITSKPVYNSFGYLDFPVMKVKYRYYYLITGIVNSK